MLNVFAKANKPKYKKQYIKYGCTCLQKDGKDLSQCVLCMKTLINSCLKPFQHKQHFNNAHKEKASESIEYVSSKKGLKGSGRTRGFIQLGNLAERNPLAKTWKTT